MLRHNATHSSNVFSHFQRFKNSSVVKILSSDGPNSAILIQTVELTDILFTQWTLAINASFNTFPIPFVTFVMIDNCNLEVPQAVHCSAIKEAILA